jgi:NAD(P)-dependent dehydrogenase (short-subunit alcohol dehydrogenase family)
VTGNDAHSRPVILVTGGSRGIGAATSRLASKRGYAVCVNYRVNREAADAVVADIRSNGGTAVAVGADVSVENEVVSLFDTCDRLLGPPAALVNNAGILETQMRVEMMDAARLQRILATNVVGAFLCARDASTSCGPASSIPTSTRAAVSPAAWTA